MTSISIPYPPIGRLGLASDRRTAALIVADGSVAWWCLPNFDGEPVFAALLDAEHGGLCRLSPARRVFGRQSYQRDTFGLVTEWVEGGAGLRLNDIMLWPEDDRASAVAGSRVLVRCLTAVGETCEYRLDLRLPGVSLAGADGGAIARTSSGMLRLWTTAGLDIQGDAARFEGTLAPGEEIWVVLAFGADEHSWSHEIVATAVDETLAYWRDYARRLTRADTEVVRRAALVVHALTYAATGAVVATVSASLPERVGGSRNFDYRYSWVRDGSLAMSLMTRCGRGDEARRYLDWLAGLHSSGPMPLQVVYRLDGSMKTHPVTKQKLHGYRGSTPVQYGNPADTLYEIDTFGYLADCLLIHVECGGTIEDAHWDLLVRLADFTAENWRQKGASIWEISPLHHFVVSKVLSWVTLDRAIRIAEITGRAGSVDWTFARREINEEVCDLGFSHASGSFRQRYESEAIDAGLLLIPLMDFLPVDDPRVTATVDRIERELSINGHVHRFVPRDIPNQGKEPVGEEEGSFLLCTCWLSQVRTKQGRLAEAKQLLELIRNAGGSTGLLPEGIDARSGDLLGNMPLIFTHVEYARAARLLADTEGS